MACPVEGDFVLLRGSNGSASIVNLTSAGTVWFMKQQMPAKPFLQHAFGTVFDVTGSTPTPIDGPLEAVPEALLAATEKDGGHARDNRDYVACDAHQQLSHKQLEAMKSSGMAGEDIISALMAGSATYSKKNAFTQQKWLANKAKKYMRRVIVLSLNPARVCDTLWSKNPQKILNVRPDMLGMILNMANLRVGGRALVMDDTGGLIVGSVAHRMIPTQHTPAPPHLPSIMESRAAGQAMDVDVPAPSPAEAPRRLTPEQVAACGSVVFAPYGPHQAGPSVSHLRYFNIPAHAVDVCMFTGPATDALIPTPADGSEVDWLPAPVRDIKSLPAAPAELVAKLEEGGDDAKAIAQPGHSWGNKRLRATVDIPKKGSVAAPGEKRKRAYPRRGPDDPLASDEHEGVVKLRLTWEAEVREVRRGNRPNHDVVKGWLREGFDSAVIAVDCDPVDLTLRAVRWVRPSGALVVYCSELAPLAKIFRALRDTMQAKNIKVQTLWTREMQVLPQRTHPMMSTDGAAGYMLSATIVVSPYQLCSMTPEEEAAAVAAAPRAAAAAASK